MTTKTEKKLNPALMKPMRPSPELAQIVGSEPREATFASSVVRRNCSLAPWPGQLNRYRAANSKVKIVASQLRVVVSVARRVADDVVWWRRRANQSLDASRTSGLLIDNLSVAQLRAAASTQPLCPYHFPQC